MSIVSLASNNSASRGYDYYEEKKVLQTEQLSFSKRIKDALDQYKEKVISEAE